MHRLTDILSLEHLPRIVRWVILFWCVTDYTRKLLLLHIIQNNSNAWQFASTMMYMLQTCKFLVKWQWCTHLTYLSTPAHVPSTALRFGSPCIHRLARWGSDIIMSASLISGSSPLVLNASTSLILLKERNISEWRNKDKCIIINQIDWCFFLRGGHSIVHFPVKLPVKSW